MLGYCGFGRGQPKGAERVVLPRRSRGEAERPAPFGAPGAGGCPGRALLAPRRGWAVMKGVHSAARADGSGQQPPLVLLILPCPGGPSRRGPAAGPGLGLRGLRPRDEGLCALAGRARRGPGGLAALERAPGPSTP